MNAEKAREYFSDYYEKQLTGALLESFERVLRQDAQVQAEYRAFEETMNSLSYLAAPVPEPDFDLHEKIAQRLDRHMFELKQQPTHSFWLPWRKLAFGGIAAVALVGAIASINMRNNSQTIGSGVVTGIESQKKAVVDLANVELMQKDGQWTLEYRSKGKDQVEILDEDGKSIQSVELNNETLSSPMQNQGSEARLLRVNFDSARNPILVALPGSETTAETMETEGKGTLEDLARTASAVFGRPVIVALHSAENKVEWKLDRSEQVSSILTAVKAMNYTVEESESGAIWIR